jgi:glycosyltransferase involved in cell wall biosynthesis
MRYLPATLESIAHQYDESFEVLVAHKPSTPDLRNPDFINEPQDVADRMNRLASIASGDYLMVLADDDILLPNALYRWRVAAQANHLPDVVMAQRQNITERGEFTDIQQTYPWTAEGFAHHNPVQGLTALVSKDAWNMAGGMDGGQLWQDYALFYECFLHGANAMTIHAPLWGYRRHADQIPDSSPLWAEAVTRLRTKYPGLSAGTP